jgi:hypothetical protein
MMAAIPASAAADPGDHPVTDAFEDKSCSIVNRAYERSYNSGRFAFKIYQLMSTGETDQYLEGRVIDGYDYNKSGNGVWKRGSPLPIRTALNEKSHTPIFTLCSEVGAENLDGVPTIHWVANWSGRGWKASIDIWIDQTAGRFIKTISRYEPGFGEFHFPVALQTFDYDRAHAIKPTVSN